MPHDAMRLAERMTRPLRQRLQGLAARGRLAFARDSAPVQLVQVGVLAGEVRDLVQRIQQYGFSSHPLPGAHPVILLCPFGDRGQAVAIAVDDVRHRPTGAEPGDTLIYDFRGNLVRLTAAGVVVTSVAALTVQVAEGATVNVEGGATVQVGEGVSVQAGAGATIEAGAGVQVQAGAGVELTATGAIELTGSAIELTAAGPVTVTSPQVNLGALGGQPVARVGDTVNLTTGLITSGSPTVRSS